MNVWICLIAIFMAMVGLCTPLMELTPPSEVVVYTLQGISLLVVGIFTIKSIESTRRAPYNAATGGPISWGVSTLAVVLMVLPLYHFGWYGPAMLVILVYAQMWWAYAELIRSSYHDQPGIPAA